MWKSVNRSGSVTSALDIPGRQRLLDQGDADIGEGWQAAQSCRFVARLVGIHNQRRSSFHRDGQTAQAGHVGFGRLGANLDLEGVVQTGGDFLFRLLDLLPGIAGSQGPQHGHSFTNHAAEELHGGDTKGLAHRVEQGAFERGLGGIVTLGGFIHAGASGDEAIRRRSDQRRRKIGIDGGLDAFDAFLASARAAKGRRFADPGRPIAQAKLDDDVALRGDGQGRQLVLPNRRHINNRAFDFMDRQVASQIGGDGEG